MVPENAPSQAKGKSMKKRIEVTSEYELEISGRPFPAEPDVGLGAGIDDLYVGVIVAGKSIDITALLTEKQFSHFEDLLLEEHDREIQDAMDAAEDAAFEEWRDSQLENS